MGDEMELDFLGTDPSNEVVGEIPTINEQVIVPARGFFFADTVVLYDTNGNEIEPNSYSFDLPAPSISSRIGRLVFGRILLNTSRPPVTIDYKTPYFLADNRVNDILKYSTDVSNRASYDYYNHFSRLFKSSNVHLDGADISPWLESLNQLITTLRNSNLGDDILIDLIDEVFTKGIIRYPDAVDIEELNNPTFISTDATGNNLFLNKWAAEWSIAGNNFSLDYEFMRNSLEYRMELFEKELQLKYTGDVAELIEVTSDEIEAVNEFKYNVRTIGLVSDNDISYSNNGWQFNDLTLPSHYDGIDTLMSDINLRINDINERYLNITDVDTETLDVLVKKYKSNLTNGYTIDQINIINNETIYANGIYLTDILTRNSLTSKVNNLYITGEAPTTTNLDILLDKVFNWDVSISLSTLQDKFSQVAYLNSNITTTLDGLCIVKSEVKHDNELLEDIGDML